MAHKKLILIACIVIVIVACVFIYWGGEQSDTPLPDKITLYSIDGRAGARKNAKEDAERFVTWPVLGKLVITSAKDRRKIVEGLKEAIEKRPERALDCFSPRHGLQWFEDGKTREFVICFQCSNYYECLDGNKVRSDKIGSTLKPILNKLLQAANIPMASESEP